MSSYSVLQTTTLLSACQVTFLEVARLRQLSKTINSDSVGDAQVTNDLWGDLSSDGDLLCGFQLFGLVFPDLQKQDYTLSLSESIPKKGDRSIFHPFW